MKKGFTLAEKAAARRARGERAVPARAVSARADTFAAVYVACAAYAAGCAALVKSAPHTSYACNGVTASASAVYRYARRLMAAGEGALESFEGVIDALGARQPAARAAARAALAALNAGRVTPWDIEEIEG